MKQILAFSLVLAVGCKSTPTSTQSASSNTAEVTLPRADTHSGVVSGNNGSISGVVRVAGDESPAMPGALTIPVGKCFKAHQMHGKVFRRGADNAAPDVLVGVTEYKGEVAKATAPVVVTMEDCALSQRTFVMTPGQELHAKNVGLVAAIPHLRGAPQAALVVAVPGGTPIVLTPPTVGRYQLIDRSHEYAMADVFVLGYSTTDVTDEAGKFDIQGIPAGEVKVSAMLPSAGLTVEKRVVVEPNKVTEVNLDLHFELAKWQADLGAAKAAADAPAVSSGTSQ